MQYPIWLSFAASQSCWGGGDAYWLRHCSSRSPQTLECLAGSWPVNGVAAALTEQWLGRPGLYSAGAAASSVGLRQKDHGFSVNSHAFQDNADAIFGKFSLIFRAPFSSAIERNPGEKLLDLLRDCRSFTGLGEWLRIGLQSPRDNRRIVRALSGFSRR